MRILIWLAIAYCAWLYLKSRSRKDLPPASGSTGEETHKDPICGVYVADDDAVIGKLGGEKLYFCSLACLEKYREQISHKG